MLALQAAVFCGTLIFAAVDDLKKRSVCNIVWVLIVMAGLITVSPASIFGAFVGFLPFYIAAGFGKMGGGDWHLTTAVGFVLGFERLVIGCFFAVISMIAVSFVRRLIHTPGSSERVMHPLVPYLAAGFIPAYFI